MAKLSKVFGWINFVLALWMILSPAIFTFQNGTVFTVIAGIVTAVIIYLAVRKPDQKGFTWTYLFISIFMFLSPWIIGFTGGAAWNMRIITLVMVVFSIWILQQKSE